MHDRDNPPWPLIRRVGYEIIPRCGEAQGTLSQIRTTVALMGKPNKRLDGCFDCVDYPVGSLKTVFRYEFPK